MRPVYYNENDPRAVLWLRNNIDAGLIAWGHVDSRSIKDVTPDDLKGYAQHHFFAGIGGWSLAARMAGWDDARPLWSASCPCQPFSQAGLGGGTDDPRHLWPDVYRLCDAARPPVLVGEQVSGADGLNWFDGVSSDLEASRYASRTVDIPACAVDSPQQRNRLYWVALALADREGERCWPGFRGDGSGRFRWIQPSNDDGAQPGTRIVAGPERAGLEGLGEHGDQPGRGGTGSGRPAPEADDRDRSLVHGEGLGRGEEIAESRVFGGRGAASGADGQDQGLDRSSGIGRPSGRDHHGRDERGEPRAGNENGGGPVASADGGGRPWSPEHDVGATGGLEPPFGDDAQRRHHPQPERRRNGSWWSGAEWIICHDDKGRRVADARAPLLAHGIRGGVPVHRPDFLRAEILREGHPLGEPVRFVNRVAAWSGFGNAISPPLAAEAIGALMDILPAWSPDHGY